MHPSNFLQQKELKKIKTRVQFIGCLAVVITQAGITLYLPSLPAMQHDLHTTSRAIAFSLTAYMAGYAFPMLFWGALSDYLGRRKSLLIAMSVYQQHYYQKH